MFTGLVEEVGTIKTIEPRGEGRRVWIAATRVLEDLSPGDSLAVDGCCLTATAIEGGAMTADVVPESVRRTTIEVWRPGTEVNLERPVRLDQRLGGHLVQGHVDGVGEVVKVAEEGEGRRVTFALPAGLARYVAEKGSIAVDGVSLTVAACDGPRFEVAYVPHTLKATVAGRYAPGRAVNLEVDLLARYVARLFDESAAKENR